MNCGEVSCRLFDLQSMACWKCLCGLLEVFGFSPVLHVSLSSTLHDDF